MTQKEKRSPWPCGKQSRRQRQAPPSSDPPILAHCLFNPSHPVGSTELGLTLDPDSNLGTRKQVSRLSHCNVLTGFKPKVQRHHAYKTPSRGLAYKRACFSSFPCTLLCQCHTLPHPSSFSVSQKLLEGWNLGGESGMGSLSVPPSSGR